MMLLKLFLGTKWREIQILIHLFVDAELSNAAAVAAATAAAADDDDHKRSYLVYLRLTVKQFVNPIEVHFG